EAVDRVEKARRAGQNPLEAEPALEEIYRLIHALPGQAAVDPRMTEIGSMIYAVKPGDGSAREQAASCQRVLGGLANITKEYATKRYRSNVINWGMLPFQMDADPDAFEVGDYIYIPGVLQALAGEMKAIPAFVLRPEGVRTLTLSIAEMTEEEKQIVRAGCLINYNRQRKGL
ncbi:MAG: hydratase, partial [Bacteroidales bacterium]|nr:hydratase [Bacteroidales bacterium]